MKRLVAMAIILVLVLPAPAWADTVTAGDLIAGLAEPDLVVAGNQNLDDVPLTNVPPGTKAVRVGNIAPPNAVAAGAAQPFALSVAVAGVGPVEDDVIAVSDFLGTNAVEAGFGNFSVEEQIEFWIRERGT